MRRHLIISIIFLFIYLDAVSQPAEKSSSNISYSHDTTIINQQIKKAFGYAQNPATLDSATHYLNQFYSLSRKRNYDKGLIEYFRIKAVTYFIQQKDDSLSQFIEKAFSQAKLLHNEKELALVIDLKAWIYQAKEESDSAAHYYIKALKIADSLNDTKFSAEISNNLSILFLGIGDYNKAAAYALSVYHRGLKLSDTLLVTNGLFNLGTAKVNLKQYDTGMILYRRVNELVKDPAKYNYVLFRSLGNEASILTDLGKFDESIKKYKEILQLSANIDPTLLSYIYSGLAAAQLKKNLFKDAGNNAEKAISIGERAGQKQALRDSYLLMSQIKEEQSDFKSALLYRKKYDTLNDTLTSETTNKNIHLLEKKYVTSKKDNQIATQQLAIAENKNIIQKKNTLNIILAVGSLLLLLFSLLIYRNFKNRHQLLKKEKELQKQKIAELEKQHQLVAMQSVLKGQEEERSRLARDLHDGVGGLLSGVKLSMSNMKGNVFLSEENTQAFSNVIVQLDQSIAELRRVSHNMMPEALIKYGLKEALENYCENLNLSGKLKVQLQTYGMETRLDQNTEIIVYRIVQELLNNIIKHAEAKNVLIQLVHEGERFNLTVEDDGKGFDINETKNGAGLANIKARAEYLDGNVDIVSKKGEGTSVNVEGKAGENT
jgi:two-component system NarL family sensor kinase